jgi:hypothetical protein
MMTGVILLIRRYFDCITYNGKYLIFIGKSIGIFAISLLQERLYVYPLEVRKLPGIVVHRFPYEGL